MPFDRRRFLTGAGAGAALAAAGVARGDFASALPGRPVAAIAPSECPVTNIVVLMMENRSFDHMLGRLPGAEGLSREMYNLDEDGERVYVHRQKEMACTIGDPHHGRAASIAQYADGRNDGFVIDSGSQTMGYMGEQEVPWFYAAAREYTAFDHWHCGILGPTWPNRSYLHAGTSGGRISNALPKNSFGLPEQTVWHQLANAGVPWKVYFTDLPFVALYFELTLRYADRFHPLLDFYSDAAAGRLPPVTLLEPGYFVGTDDHPPASVQGGQRFMADVVHALQQSPQWPSTALIITYDEHGGFHDHVAPPQLPDDIPELGQPVGFRVPALLVSPWARRGFVGHTVHDHTSATSFIQWRFGLPPLSTRNAAANDFLYAFDFSSPRTDLPALPIPHVDEALASLCLAGKFIGPGEPIDMPGGEGAEPEHLWESADLTPVGRAAATMREGGPVTLPDTAAAGAAAAAATGVTVPISGQEELAEAADAGVIPAELDLRPRPGRPTPSPFLPAGSLPPEPAWREPPARTATKPRPSPARY